MLDQFLIQKLTTVIVSGISQLICMIFKREAQGWEIKYDLCIKLDKKLG